MSEVSRSSLLSSPSGRVVVVTGGSRGIGAATAALAAERGYEVAFAYRNSGDRAAEVARRIEAAGRRVLPIRADISREQEVLHLFDEAAKIGPLAALVNNAAVLEQQCRVESLEHDRIERIFATNVTGAFLCAREAVRRMSTAHGASGGAIVNVSSVAAASGAPGEYVDYAASKAAVEALTIGLAKEVAGEGIRVNTVRPGFIHTEIHASGGEPNRVDRVKAFVPMRRGGEPDEVARAILWLLSEEASYVSGACLNVAGGN